MRYTDAMNDALKPDAQLMNTQRKIGYLELAVAWVAILVMFFFFHEFGRRVTVQVVLMGAGALVMFILAAKTLSRSRTR